MCTKRSASFPVRRFGAICTTVLLLFSLTSFSAEAAPKIKIAIAYDIGGRGDHGINDSAAKGVDFIKKKYNLTALSVREMVTNGTESDREDRLQFLASANYNLIVAVGSGYAQAVNVVSSANPSTQFALINDSSVGNLNLTDLVFSNPDGAYLAGVLAGAATKSNKVGFISPTPLASYFSNFKKGVASVKPKALAVSQVIDVAPTIGVQTLISQGVDIIFSEWSSTSEVQDAIAKLTTTKHPIHLIGVDPDQYFLLGKSSQKILIGAVSKYLDKAVEDVMAAALKGQDFLDVLDSKQGIFGHLYTVKNGGESIALTKLGAPYASKVAAAIAALKSGKVKS